MKGSKVWTFERPKMRTFYTFEPLNAHTYEQNISLIRLTSKGISEKSIRDPQN